MAKRNETVRRVIDALRGECSTCGRPHNHECDRCSVEPSTVLWRCVQCYVAVWAAGKDSKHAKDCWDDVERAYRGDGYGNRDLDYYKP